jgi:hypothetical protein
MKEMENIAIDPIPVEDTMNLSEKNTAGEKRQ